MDNYKRVDIELIKKTFLEKGLKPLFEDRKNSNEKLLCENEDGYKCIISYQKLKDGRTPMSFSNSNPYTFDNIDLFLIKNTKGYIFADERVNFKSSIKFKWKCEKGHDFEMSWNSIKNGRRCPKCFGCFKKSTEEFKKEIKSIVNNEYELLSDYKRDNVHVEILHNECGHKYKVTPSHFLQGKRCPKCSVRRGIENNKYNPNLSEEDRVSRRVKDGESISKWRTTVFEKHNYTCKICNEKGGILNAHHLNGYHWFKEGRFDIENGVCLCKNCHTEFHNKYGRKNNTIEQFNEFSLRKGVKV